MSDFLLNWNNYVKTYRRLSVILTDTIKHVGFEVLTVVVMKSSVFWDITTCSPLKVNQRFGETCCLHLQGWRVSQATNQQEAEHIACEILGLSVVTDGLASKVPHVIACCLLHASFLLGLFFNPEDGDDMFFWSISWLIGLHSIIFQKTELFTIKDGFRIDLEVNL
jgi:hypothetical protein